MTTENELYKALVIVEREARAKYNYWVDQLEKEKPMNGWSQEQHDDYCNREIYKAQMTADWCFIRQMQINPD